MKTPDTETDTSPLRAHVITGKRGGGMSFALEHLATEAYIGPKKIRCPECMRTLTGTPQGFGIMYLCRFCYIMVIKLREGSERIRVRMGKDGITIVDPESDVCRRDLSDLS